MELWKPAYVYVCARCTHRLTGRLANKVSFSALGTSMMALFEMYARESWLAQFLLFPEVSLTMKTIICSGTETIYYVVITQIKHLA